MKVYYVYILASRTRSLYIGITRDLERRLWEHRNGTGRGHAWKYREFRLVYFEEWNDPRSAIAREKQLKGWRRSRKVALIESLNPQWRDFAERVEERSAVYSESPTWVVSRALQTLRFTPVPTTQILRSRSG